MDLLMILLALLILGAVLCAAWAIVAMLSGAAGWGVVMEERDRMVMENLNNVDKQYQ